MAGNNKKDLATLLEEFIERLRGKMKSSDHKFKKTARLNMQVKFPEYKEGKEDKDATPFKKIDLQNVISKGYDLEILEKFRRFLEFLRDIFKKEKPS